MADETPTAGATWQCEFQGHEALEQAVVALSVRPGPALDVYHTVRAALQEVSAPDGLVVLSLISQAVANQFETAYHRVPHECRSAIHDLDAHAVATAVHETLLRMGVPLCPVTLTWIHSIVFCGSVASLAVWAGDINPQRVPGAEWTAGRPEGGSS